MSNKNKKIKADEDLTTDMVRQFNGFEGISDEEAQSIADSLKMFSLILFDHLLKQNLSE